MIRSFELVEDKLREAEFFLDLFSHAPAISKDAKFFFSAFVSASRSVTFSLQACLNDIDGFSEWYSAAQARLKSDGLAKYFVELRNRSQKTGENPVNQVDTRHLCQHLASQLNSKPSKHFLINPYTQEMIDAVDACDAYLTSLTGVVYDCYMKFLTIVDPQWYFTEAAFSGSGKTLLDALLEMGYPSSWADAVPEGVDAWLALSRLQPSCSINNMFYARLGKIVPRPKSR